MILLQPSSRDLFHICHASMFSAGIQKAKLEVTAILDATSRYARLA
jgi:hypothetical protein